MTKIIGNSTSRDRVNSLLDKSFPAYRQAYSDRKAWLMACLSELAYIRFNPLFSNSKQKEWFLGNISTLLDDSLVEGSKVSSLTKLIDTIAYDHDEERNQLESELKTIRIQLVETFDRSGTQAILVASHKFIALAFRGTESDKMEDIKTDLRAKTTQCETGGKIHIGFQEAYEKVAVDIQAKIDEPQFQEKPLFITGHSLGGALAMIAAKKLTHKGGIAACYTFGAPRVGDEEWISDIKTPVYRLVNAADCVPMLPLGDEMVSCIAGISRGISKLHVPWVSPAGEAFSRWLLSKYGGYRHGGYMRYLTNCPPGSYERVRLLYAVSFFRRVKGVFIKKLRWKKFLSDHSMSIYRKKLLIIAESRNP